MLVAASTMQTQETKRVGGSDGAPPAGSGWEFILTKEGRLRFSGVYTEPVEVVLRTKPLPSLARLRTESLSALVLALIFSIQATSAQTISGVVINDRMNRPMFEARVMLFDSTNTDTLKKVYTNRKGRFKFENLDKGDYYLEVKDGWMDKKRIALFLRLTSDTTLMLHYDRICEFDKSKYNQTCPVCKKPDQAIPIVYGLPAYTPDGYPTSFELPNGDLVSVNKNGEQYYSGGCEVTECDPNWYCKRDKTKF